MYMKKMFLIIFVSVLLAGIVFVLVASCVNLDKIVITNPNFQELKDGTFQGNSKVGPVRVTLNVTVRNRAITFIEIVEHFNGRGKKAEEIVPLIIEKQSLEVDVISGATGSSKAILKAVEDALRQQN